MKRTMLKSGIISVFVLGLVSFGFMSCQSKTQVEPNQEVNEQAIAPENFSKEAVVAADAEHKAMTVEEFDKAIASEKLTMVDFYTTWCGPCKMMAPFIEQIKNEQSSIVNVLKVDAEAQLDISERYKLEGYPTIIFFKKGEVIYKQLGALDKEGLMQLVNKYK